MLVCGAILFGALQAHAQGTPLPVPLPDAIKARGHLVVGVKCDFPPLGYISADDQHVGFEIDVVHHLAGYAFGNPDAVDLVCVAGPNRIPFILSGRVDFILSVLSYTADRAKIIRLSQPYFDSGVRMVVPNASKVANWSDLTGQTVTTTTGSTPSIWMDRCMKDVHQLLFDNTADSLAALKQGRAITYVQDITLLVGIVSKDHSLKIVGDSMVRGPLNVGMKLDAAELGTWIDAAITQMTHEDFFWTTFAKWVPAEVLPLFADGMPRPGGRQILNAEADDIYKCL